MKLVCWESKVAAGKQKGEGQRLSRTASRSHWADLGLFFFFFFFLPPLVSGSSQISDQIWILNPLCWARGPTRIPGLPIHC